MHSRKLSVATLALAGAFGLLAACGAAGGNTAGTGFEAAPGSSLAGMPGDAVPAPSMPAMDMPSTSGTAGTAPVGADAVAIRNFTFVPATLTVKAGTKVTWTNQDSDAHTVTSTGSGGPLNSKAMATGDTFSFSFTEPGTYRYLCTIHPFMTATVVVTP